MTKFPTRILRTCIGLFAGGVAAALMPAGVAQATPLELAQPDMTYVVATHTVTAVDATLASSEVLVAPSDVAQVVPTEVLQAAPSVTPSFFLPAATAKTVKLSTHCDAKHRWKLIYKGQDADLKFRVWYYQTKAKNRSFCFKEYKLRSRDTNEIAITAKNYKGTWRASTTGQTLWVRVAVPKKKKGYVTAEYAGESYQTMVLYGSGAK